MHRRKAIVGLCMACALLASAFATQGAAAATKGTTAFTCKEKKEGGGAGFSKAHCAAADAVGSGAKFEHVSVAPNTTTEVLGSNETTEGSTQPFKLKYTMAGVAFTFNATGVQIAGSLENRLDASGEHYVEGEATLTFTGVTSSNTGCKVYTDAGGEVKEAGVIHTEPLTVTTKGQGDHLLFVPKGGGEVIARFWQKECKVSALDGTDTVRGFGLTSTTDGSTIKFTHNEVTVGGFLGGTAGTSGGGGAVGIEGSLTIKGRDPSIAEDVYKPISPTTVET